MRTLWRWIGSILKKRKLLVSIVFVLVAAESVVPLAAIYMQKELIDTVFVKRQTDAFVRLLVLLVGSMIAADGLYSVTRYVQLVLELRLRKQLTVAALHALYERFAVETKTDTGARMQFITADLEASASFLARRLPEALQLVVEGTVLIIAIWWASPAVLLLLAIAAPCYLVIGRRFAPQLKQMAVHVRQQRGQLLGFFEESIAATRDILAFGRRSWERDRYERLYSSYFDTVMEEGKLGNRHLFYAEPIKWIIQLAVLGFGGYAVMAQAMTVGTFVLLYPFATRLLQTTERAYRFVAQTPAALVGVEQFRHRCGDVDDAQAVLAVAGRERWTSLSFQHVSYAYEAAGPQVLRNMTCELPVGKQIAIVGASGSGKSTMARLLLGIAEPTAGVVLVNGSDRQLMERARWRRHIGVVFQEPFFVPDTVWNNMTLGRPILQPVVEQTAHRCGLAEAAAQWRDGWETNVGERGSRLSGGERKRVAVARALLRDPAIVLLDEATSALDVETEQQLCEALKQEGAGRTVIWIAHTWTTVRNADWVIVLENGQIAGQGTPTELAAANELFKQLFRTQIEEETA